MTSNSELRKILKYIIFMKSTEKFASLSYDPKHRVASIIADSNFSEIRAVGYNGNYPGGKNVRDSLLTGESGFLHAEENALLQADLIHSESYILFVTMTPCKMCAKRIATKRKNIKEVIALDLYGDGIETEEIFKNSGIEFHFLNNKIAHLYMRTFLFVELAEVLDISSDKEELEVALQNLIIKQIGYFFEFDKTPLNNISFAPIDITDNKKDVCANYIKYFFDSLYKIL